MDHEFRISILERSNDQMNRKLNIIVAVNGAIFTAVLAPIVLHALKLV